MAGVFRFTMVNFALVSCAGNSRIMKGLFTIINLSLLFQKRVYQLFIQTLFALVSSCHTCTLRSFDL